MGPNKKFLSRGSWMDLLDNIDQEMRQKERQAELLRGLGVTLGSNDCQACSQPFDDKHHSVEYVDREGRISYRCGSMPHPDAVTEDDLAYVRRSILGEENA